MTGFELRNLWYSKWPLYRLCHNQDSVLLFSYKKVFSAYTLASTQSRASLGHKYTFSRAFIRLEKFESLDGANPLAIIPYLALIRHKNAEDTFT